MNFLAHLHLASLANSSLIGNLAADFIRGDPYKDYPKPVADGIMLHRRIDVLVDSLKEVKVCRLLFSPQHRRVAPITLDILWDHFLSKNWSILYPKISLPEFCFQSESIILPDISIMPTDFQSLNNALWREQWLIQYANLPFIKKTLQRMSQRRPKLALLATSFSDISKSYEQFQQVFFQFYPMFMLCAQQQQL